MVQSSAHFVQKVCSQGHENGLSSLQCLQTICRKKAATLWSINQSVLWRRLLEWRGRAAWLSGFVHRFCVLMAESSKCGFESWPRPWWFVSLNKTLYHDCFSPPRSKWVHVRARVRCFIWFSPICAEMAANELHTPQGAEMVSGMIYEPDEQG